MHLVPCSGVASILDNDVGLLALKLLCVRNEGSRKRLSLFSLTREHPREDDHPNLVAQLGAGLGFGGLRSGSALAHRRAPWERDSLARARTAAGGDLNACPASSTGVAHAGYVAFRM